jgi:3-oxoacyl-[acyl-carrier protein] reductase
MKEPNILLIGASGGIGSQLAAKFNRDSVVLHYHRQHPECDFRCVSADIADYPAVEKMVQQAAEMLGSVDVLINAAGVSIDGFLHKYSPDDWRSVIDTNLTGSFHLLRAVLPLMRAQRFGRIITMASVVYQRPVLGTSSYSTSKAGLVGLTRTAAIENASFGITCNCIALGYFDAGMGARLPQELRDEISQAIPMKRFGRVDELQRAIEFLIKTEYVTGQVISLNGGLYMD